MTKTSEHDRLDDRKAAILKSVVTGYVETAQPVGSSQVARDPMIDVSPATVRSEMAALERDGFLTHPHTSAGRIPTDRGYRFFVDHLGSVQPLGEAEQVQVQSFFSGAHGELERILRDTTDLLVRLTDCAAVVVSPAADTLVVRSVQLTRLSGRNALVVAVLSNGVVEKRLVALAEDCPDSAIGATTAIVGGLLNGQPLGTVTQRPRVSDPVVEAIVTSCLDAVAEPDPAPGSNDQVFVGGAARMAERFDAIDQIRAVLGILEQSFVVVTLLRDVLAHGQSVSIGSEHAGVEPLAECSLVVAPYEAEGVAIGTIGVLGPTRMDYEHALAAVAVVGQRLTRELRGA